MNVGTWPRHLGSNHVMENLLNTMFRSSCQREHGRKTALKRKGGQSLEDMVTISVGLRQSNLAVKRIFKMVKHYADVFNTFSLLRRCDLLERYAAL